MGKKIQAVGALGLAAGAVVLAAGPAAAHIEPVEEEVPAGSEAVVTLQVPHGCEDSPTRQLAVQIPEGVLDATPQVHPGWDIDTTTEQLDTPVTMEDGDEITEAVTEVTFTAQPGNELDPHQRDEFSIGYLAPDTPGDYLFFKTVQTCVEGETAWIEEFTGEGEEPENPAPAVLVTDAESEDMASGGAAEESGDNGDQQAAADETSQDEDSDSTGLAIAALVVGVLGLAAGGFALIRTRKPTAG